jgi:hypothetical protein
MKEDREVIHIEKEEIGDFTKDSGSWKIKGETYKYIETNRTDGDGEWFDVVVQRKSDKKYFEFSWGISYSQTYHYEPRWREVKPTTIKKTIYK